MSKQCPEQRARCTGETNRWQYSGQYRTLVSPACDAVVTTIDLRVTFRTAQHKVLRTCNTLILTDRIPATSLKGLVVKLQGSFDNQFFLYRVSEWF